MNTLHIASSWELFVSVHLNTCQSNYFRTFIKLRHCSAETYSSLAVQLTHNKIKDNAVNLSFLSDSVLVLSSEFADCFTENFVSAMINAYVTSRTRQEEKALQCIPMRFLVIKFSMKKFWGCLTCFEVIAYTHYTLLSLRLQLQPSQVRKQCAWSKPMQTDWNCHLSIKMEICSIFLNNINSLCHWIAESSSMYSNVHMWENFKNFEQQKTYKYLKKTPFIWKFIYKWHQLEFKPCREVCVHCSNIGWCDKQRMNWTICTTQKPLSFIWIQNSCGLVCVPFAGWFC